MKKLTVKQKVAKTVTQKDIPAIVKGLDEQLDNLYSSKELKYKYKTEGVKLDPFGEIKHISDPRELIQAHSYVKNNSTFYTNSAVELGYYKNCECLFNNVASQKWLEDIVNRAKSIKTRDKINKLKTYIVKLKKHLPQEHKISADIEEIRTDILETLNN